MQKQIVILENDTGLHARPASEIAKIAMKYKGNVNLIVDGKKINAKSPLMIMSAGIKPKAKIEIECDGDGETEVLRELVMAFDNNFGE
jgi:phosphocarrier protein